MVEDFTHVLPEDLPAKPRKKATGIYDLDELNRRAKHYQDFRAQCQDVYEKAKAAAQARAESLRAK